MWFLGNHAAKRLCLALALLVFARPVLASYCPCDCVINRECQSSCEELGDKCQPSHATCCGHHREAKTAKANLTMLSLLASGGLQPCNYPLNCNCQVRQEGVSIVVQSSSDAQKWKPIPTSQVSKLFYSFQRSIQSLACLKSPAAEICIVSAQIVCSQLCRFLA